jgi:hypothetical protein
MAKIVKEFKPKLNHSKDWYAAQLRNNVCVVVFEKVNGEERTMICTTLSDVIETFSGPKLTERVVSVPDSQVRVFDIQKKEWRSFKTDSVISFQIVDEK